MSKVQYILLAAIIGFYAMLFALLIARGLIGLFRSTNEMVPRLGTIKERVLGARGRAWTRAVWRGSLVQPAPQ
jgi:hypothetical protein